MKQSVIDQMEEYKPKKNLKAIKYKEGMEDGWRLEFYNKRYPSFYKGVIICDSYEQLEEEMKKTEREIHLYKNYKDNELVPVGYKKPVPVIISYKYSEEECNHMSEIGLMPETCFKDDNEAKYYYKEITSKNCWIIKNREGLYTIVSSQYMKDYELVV